MIYHMCPGEAWAEAVAPVPLGADGNHLFPPPV
jgi:hypothetical protein